MNGVSGLTGLTINGGQEASPQQKYGDPVDPRHAESANLPKQPWEVYPGEPHGPYGTENGLLGMPIASSGGGILLNDPTADRQPLTHGAPWPKGVDQTVEPEGEADSLRESYEIHSSGFGFGRRAWSNPASAPSTDPAGYQDIELVDPGSFVRPLADMPDQQKGMPIGGAGQRDRVQSFAPQNQYGFDSAHVIRRWGRNGLPGNFLWMQGGFRPLVSARVGPAVIPTGPDSPFAGQSGKRGYGPQSSALFQLPAPYVVPPEPAQATDYPSAPVTPGRVRLW